MAEEESLVESLRNKAEEALTTARQGREGVERERGEMLKGFQDVRVALEVSVRRVMRGMLGFGEGIRNT